MRQRAGNRQVTESSVAARHTDGFVRLYISGGLILLVLGGFAVAAADASRRGDRSSAGLINLALVAAFAAIVAVTLSPSDGDHDVRLRPFAEIRLAVTPPFSRAWIAEIAGNILLFVPLGVVLCLRHATLRRSVGIALGLSTAVELIQLLLPGRATAFDDVACNTAGAALGWFTAWIVHRPMRVSERVSSPER
jgi:hypothetical protein